jgi:hypothetical protein
MGNPLVFVVVLGRVDFLFQFLGDEQVVEEEQDCRQCGNLEPGFKKPIGHRHLLSPKLQILH